jgi:hypothetical protein
MAKVAVDGAMVVMMQLASGIIVPMIIPMVQMIEVIMVIIGIGVIFIQSPMTQRGGELRTERRRHMMIDTTKKGHDDDDDNDNDTNSVEGDVACAYKNQLANLNKPRTAETVLILNGDMQS